MPDLYGRPVYEDFWREGEEEEAEPEGDIEMWKRVRERREAKHEAAHDQGEVGR